MEESKSKIPAELMHFSRMIEDSCVFDSAMDATENLLIALRHGNVSKEYFMRCETAGRLSKKYLTSQKHILEITYRFLAVCGKQ